MLKNIVDDADAICDGGGPEEFRADLVVRARRPNSGAEVSSGETKVKYPDSELVSRICGGYEVAGIPRAIKKTFEMNFSSVLGALK